MLARRTVTRPTLSSGGQVSRSSGRTPQGLQRRFYASFESLQWMPQPVKLKQPRSRHVPGIQSVPNPWKLAKPNLNQILHDPHAAPVQTPDPMFPDSANTKRDAKFLGAHPGLAARRCFALRSNAWATNNAVDLDIVKLLRQYFKKYEWNHHLTSVIWRSADYHLCPGADLKKIHQSLQTPDKAYALAFYKEVLETVYSASTTYKPWFVALDGNVMGVGAGLSMFFSVPMATERSAFAMPGCQYGWTGAEGGMSYLLSRLPRHVGEYLALTGKRIEGSDLTRIGLAYNYLPGDRLNELEERLGFVEEHDYRTILDTAQHFEEHLDEPTFEKYIPAIEECFSKATVGEIMLALQNLPDDGSGWVTKCIERLRSASPLSLAVTLRAIRTARFLSLEETLQMEWGIARQFIRHPSHQLANGIDYVFNLTPTSSILYASKKLWAHEDISQVKASEVEEFFKPVPEGERLVFERLATNKRPDLSEEMKRYYNADPLTKSWRDSEQALQLYKLNDASLDELLEFTRRIVAQDAQYISLAHADKIEKHEKRMAQVEIEHYVDIEDDKAY